MKRLTALAASLALSIAPAFAQVGPPIGPVNGSGGGGGVSSISTTCPSSGPTTGAITLSPSSGRLVSGTTDTLVASDCGGAVEYSNASPTAVSLTAAASLGAGWCANISVDTGAGLVTVTSAGGNFNTTGTTALTIAATIGTTICTNAAANGFVVSGSGTGNVSGPGSAVSGHLAVYSGTSGKILADGGAVPSGFQPIAAYKSGNWHRSLYASSGATQSTNISDSVIYCHPFIVSAQGMTVKGIGATLTTFGTGNVSMAIFKADGTGGRPSTFVDQLATAVTTASGASNGALVNAAGGDALLAGMNWLCIIADNTTVSTVRFDAITAGLGSWGQQFVGSASVTNVLSSSAATTGLSCIADGTTAATKCGSGLAAWASGAYTWASLSSASFSEVTSGILPEMFLQAF